MGENKTTAAMEAKGRNRAIALSHLDDDYLLTPREVGAAGGPPRRTLDRYRAEGGGPPYVRLGRKIIRYRVGDYRAWLGASTFAHAAEETVARQAATSASART